jgi:hypothetical protein
MQEDTGRAKNSPSFSGLSNEQKLKKMLQILQEDKEYANEYSRFVKDVSYAAEGAVPEYEEALEAVTQLTQAAKAS